MDPHNFSHVSAFWRGPAPVHAIAALAHTEGGLVSGAATGELVYWKDSVPHSLLVRLGCGRITSLACYSLSGSPYLLAGTYEGFVALWQINDMKCLMSDLALPSAVDHLLVHCSASRAYLLCCCSSSSELLVSALPELKTIRVIKQTATMMEFKIIPGSDLLLVLMSSGVFHVWSIVDLIGDRPLDKPLLIFLPILSATAAARMPEAFKPITFSIFPSPPSSSPVTLSGQRALIICRGIFFLLHFNRFDSALESAVVNIKSIMQTDKSETFVGGAAITADKFAVWTSSGSVFVLSITPASGQYRSAVHVIGKLNIPAPQIDPTQPAESLHALTPAPPSPFTAILAHGGSLVLGNGGGQLIAYEIGGLAHKGQDAQTLVNNEETAGEAIKNYCSISPASVHSIRDAFVSSPFPASPVDPASASASCLIALSPPKGSSPAYFSIARGYETGRVVLFLRDNEAIELLPAAVDLASSSSSLSHAISQLTSFATRYLLATTRSNRMYLFDIFSHRVLLAFSVPGHSILSVFGPSDSRAFSDLVFAQHADFSVRVLRFGLPSERQRLATQETLAILRGVDSPVSGVYASEAMAALDNVLLLTRLHHVFVFNLSDGSLEMRLTNGQPAESANPVTSHLFNAPGMNSTIFMQLHQLYNKNSQIAILLYQHLKQQNNINNGNNSPAQLAGAASSVPVHGAPHFGDKLIRKLHAAGHSARSSLVQGLANIVHGHRSSINSGSAAATAGGLSHSTSSSSNLSAYRVRDAGTSAAIALALADCTDIVPEATAGAHESRPADAPDLDDEAGELSRRRSYSKPIIDHETRSRLLLHQQARRNDEAARDEAVSASPIIGAAPSPAYDPPSLKSLPIHTPFDPLSSVSRYLLRPVDLGGSRAALQVDLLQVNLLHFLYQLQVNATADPNLNALLALLLDWPSRGSPVDGDGGGELKRVEHTLINHFSIMPPLVQPSPVVASDYNHSYAILFPNFSSHPHSRYCFSPVSSALHTLSLHLLSAPLLLHNDIAIQERWSKIANYFTGVLPSTMGAFMECDIDTLAAHAMHANFDLSSAARAMIQGVVERASKTQKMEWMNKCVDAIKRREATIEGSAAVANQGPSSSSPTNSGSRIKAVAPPSGFRLFRLSDSDLLPAIVACQVAYSELAPAADTQPPDTPLLALFRSVGPAVCALLSRVLFACTPEDFLVPTKTAPNDITRLIVVVELMWRGLPLLCPFIASPSQVTRKLFLLSLLVSSIPSGPSPGSLLHLISAAHRCLLEFGRLQVGEFLSTLSRELINTAKQLIMVKQHAASLMGALVKKSPLSVLSVLSSFIQTFMTAIDPSDSAIRKALLPIVIPAIETLASFYPMVFHHVQTQRLFVGTGAGQNNLIICYDLISASRFQIFSGHTGEISALTVNPAGNRLVSYSAADASLRVWQVEVKDRSGLLASLLSQHQADGKCIKLFAVSKLQPPGPDNLFYQDGWREKLAASESSNSFPASSAALALSVPGQKIAAMSPTNRGALLAASMTAFDNAPSQSNLSSYSPSSLSSDSARLVAKCLLSVRFLWRSPRLVELNRENGSKLEYNIE